MQYKVESLKVGIVEIREQLKDIGKDGWELVCIVHQPKAYKAHDDISEYIAYFKK
jgi:hypothetical protein